MTQNAIIQARTDDPSARTINPLVGVLTGNQAHKGWIAVNQWGSSTVPSSKFRNTNAGGASIQARNAADDTTIFEAGNGGVTVGGTLTVSGTTTFNGALVANSTLTANGAATFNSTLTANGVVTANSTFTANSTVNLGNGNGDAITVIGVTTFRNEGNTATQLYVDAANNRVIVGSATAMGSDTTPALHVAGRLYVAPESANDLALQLRRSSGATVGWSLGVESTNDLIFKDDSNTSIARIGDSTSTWQLQVITGDAKIQDLLAVGGVLVIGADAAAGTEELRVVGQSRMEGALTITTGGLGVTGSSAFNNAVSIVSGGLTVISGDTALQKVGFNGQSPFTAPNYTLNSFTVELRTLNESSGTLSDVREVLCTLLNDLGAGGGNYGLLS